MIITFILLPLLYTYQYAGNKNLSTSTGHQIKTIVKDGNDNYDINLEYKPYPLNEYGLEVTINNATGYAPIRIAVKNENSITSNTLLFLNPGDGFRIIKESGEWWYIYLAEKNIYGWVQHKYCMINLPDVIPSIIYDNTNSYSSKFRSYGYDIDNITSKALYNTKTYNERLETNTYNMPVIYAFAKKIAKAQQEALKDQNSLKIYETYRPSKVQKSVASNLRILAAQNEDVYNNLINGYWNDLSWFISESLSNHQIGIAMDVSLAKITKWQKESIGLNLYIKILSYSEYMMPTEIHELSINAISLQYPVSPASITAWKNVPAANSMTEGSMLLREYCTSNGLIPLASEWWHFNDFATKNSLGNSYSLGDFYITSSYSIKPDLNLIIE